MNSLKSAAYTLSVITVLAACKDNNQFSGYQKSPDGLYSKFYLSHEGGRKAKTGEYASITIRYTTSKDSVLFDSHTVKEVENGYIDEPITAPTFKGGLEEALLSMAEGDSASFKMSADSIFLKTFRQKQLPKFIEPGSMLTFYIKLGKVRTQQELINEMVQKENNMRDDYIKQNKITVKPSPTGLYYIEKEPGTGKVIQPGQTAMVKYSGSFLDGKVFDSSELHGDKTFDVPVGKGKVIPGWDEALLKMKKGGKAMLVIPSSLAYGSQGSGPIKGFSSLVFNIEVVDVK